MKKHDQINWNRTTVTIGIAALFSPLSLSPKMVKLFTKPFVMFAMEHGVMGAPKYRDKAGGLTESAKA